LREILGAERSIGGSNKAGGMLRGRWVPQSGLLDIGSVNKVKYSSDRRNSEHFATGGLRARYSALGGKPMQWAFRILAVSNGLIMAVMFLYQSPGEDPAGAGMRLGFAVFYALVLGAVLLTYHFVRTSWVRVPLLVLLGLPLLSIVYTMALSL
jgi:hypothetical protein